MGTRARPRPYNPPLPNYSAGTGRHELGGAILVHGGTRLCGLTPVQASPTSHQDHAALTSSIGPVRCTRLPAPDTSFRGGGFTGPPKGPTNGLWASSSRKKQAGAPNPSCSPECRLHSGCHPSLRWSPDYTWLSHSLFL